MVSDFAAAEVASALSRLVRMDRLTMTEAKERLADFDDWRAGATERADMDAHDCRLANSYVRRFELKLRAPDALHAAICRRLGLRLVTLDRRLAAAARELGIDAAGSRRTITLGAPPMSNELVFYTNPMSRGRIVRWMLEEVGQPYRTELLDYATTMKAPEYLAINPMGKVPALRHGDTVDHRMLPRSAPIWPMRFPPPDWRRHTVTGCAGRIIAGCSSRPARWRRRGPTRRWVLPCRRNASGWPVTAASRP